jgi:hypothetical protein
LLFFHCHATLLIQQGQQEAMISSGFWVDPLSPFQGIVTLDDSKLIGTVDWLLLLTQARSAFSFQEMMQGISGCFGRNTAGTREV